MKVSKNDPTKVSKNDPSAKLEKCGLLEHSRDREPCQPARKRKACPTPHGVYPLNGLEHQPYLFIDADRPLAEHYPQIASRLKASGGEFRRPPNGGLVIVPSEPGYPLFKIATGRQLADAISERVRLCIVREGSPTGNRLSTHALEAMVNCDRFLNHFAPLDGIDWVTERPDYMSNLELTRTGSNDSGPGQRIFYAGAEPEVLRTTVAIDIFLNMTEFHSNADRTNAVAAAITSLLRRQWPGGKPLIHLGKVKFHGFGKGVDGFITGGTESAHVEYEADQERLRAALLSKSTESCQIGHYTLTDDSRELKEIDSPFLERILVDPHHSFHSISGGPNAGLPNDFVVAVIAEFGNLSAGLTARALPIYFGWGNSGPAETYFHDNEDTIMAELRGMIEGWKSAGRPLADAGTHPCAEWSRVVGGILALAGFRDFLANYPAKRIVEDPVRRALADLGAEIGQGWHSAAELAAVGSRLGLGHRLSTSGRGVRKSVSVRSLDKVLETCFEPILETLAGGTSRRFLLERRRHGSGDPARDQYRFAPLPLDCEGAGSEDGDGVDGHSDTGVERFGRREWFYDRWLFGARCT